MTQAKSNEIYAVYSSYRQDGGLSFSWTNAIVFLERRSSASGLQSNKLVSIFLRLLEYYQGVMFLTTNRVASFDPAFESRIHLTINYPKLDSTSRLQIWRTFAKRDTTSLSDDDLEELAKVELNGRQIKNVMKTARLLALSEGSVLTLSYVQDALKIKGVL